MDKDLQQILFDELTQLLQPFQDILNSPAALDVLLKRLGWDPEFLPASLTTSLTTAAQAATNQVTSFSPGTATVEDVIASIRAAKELIEAAEQFARGFESVAELSAAEAERLLKDALSLLLFDYLDRRARPLLSTFSLLGLLDNPDPALPVEAGGRVIRSPVAIPRFNLSRLGGLLSDPVQELKSVYAPDGLGDADKAFEFAARLYPRVADLINSLGIVVYLKATRADEAGYVDTTEFEKDTRTLIITDPGRRVRIEAAVLSAAENNGEPALELVPAGVLDAGHTFGKWRLGVTAGGELPPVTISPSGVSVTGTAGARLRVDLSRFGIDGEPALVIGSTEGSRLEFGWLRAGASFESASGDFGFHFAARESAFVVDPAGSDGFLKAILPPDGLNGEFDFGFKWSRNRGFEITGSLGLEAEIPLHLSLGDSLSLDAVHVLIGAEDGRLSTGLGLSASVQLGPVTAAIRRIGLRLAYRFGDSEPKGLDFGILPPTGAGFGVDAGPITGGGFLDFDEKNERYAGVLALALGEISITAIGLITTRLPGGKRGFSILISIGVIFDPPIELSMGFTLSGVGGLVGLNRTMVLEELQKGVRAGTLDSILFPDPKKVIVNAKQIISDMRAVFPAFDGRFVVGPMIRIGWGSPENVIYVEVGVFIALPEPIAIALLGKLKATFPTPDDDIVRINLHILGTLSLEKKELTFQASLFDSELLGISLYGDSALLLNWGARKEFILSFGGFHPKFDPPPPEYIFGGMRRMGLMITWGSAIFLLCEGYLALTPNSFQFGARVEAGVNIDPVSANGSFAFDALFYFNPFSFEISAEASLYISVMGWTLADAEVDFILSGPTPWHAAGSATIKLLFFDVSGSFDETWGRHIGSTLPPVNPWPPLQEALEANAGWSAALPQTSKMVERLKLATTQEEPQPLVVHPAGSLEVRQTTVPFDVRLRKFGTAPVSGYDRFELQGFEIGSGVQAPAGFVEEDFARGQFDRLSEHQRLSAPSFEKMVAGGNVSADPIAFSSEVQCRRGGYESVYITDNEHATNRGVGTLDGDLAKQFADGSAGAHALHRLRGAGRFAVSESATQIRTGERRFYIVDADTLQPYAPAEDGLVTPRANTTSGANNPIEAPGAAAPRVDRSRWKVEQVLAAYLRDNPKEPHTLMIVAEHEVAA